MLNIYLDFINEPVYLIERFDRYKKDNIIYRLPVKDATQVLNIGKENKYYDASIDNLLLFLENVSLFLNKNEGAGAPISYRLVNLLSIHWLIS